MTIRELEQALLVNTDPREPHRHIRRVTTELNFVQMCGPIVEVVGDRLQFVHFTVSECVLPYFSVSKLCRNANTKGLTRYNHRYIFSAKIENHIEKSMVNESLAATLVAYLASGVLQLDLSDEQIDMNLLAGHYRLFEYARSYWPPLLKSMKLGKQTKLLLDLLKILVKKGRNDAFDNDSSDIAEQPHDNNRYLRKHYEEVQIALHDTFRLLTNDDRWSWGWKNSMC